MMVCLLVCGAFPAAAKAEESPRRVVRVAFPEQEGMSYVSRSGKITGYNYDNALNAEILQYMLEDAGAHVTLVEDGRQELEAFRSSEVGHFGLILTDILMPEMDGYEASRAIRALERPDAATVPIIAISANSFPEDIEKSKAAGINGYISKPVDPSKLESLIAELLNS